MLWSVEEPGKNRLLRDVERIGEIKTFLDKKTVMAFHRDQIKTDGGKQGIRVDGLLESAPAQPQSPFGGEYVHDIIFQMAVTYGFHISKNPSTFH